MTETDYEHECMRAELLGVDKPSREEFFSRKAENADRENDEMENRSSDLTQELDLQGEGLNRASGGLDELNNILSVTQKKINHLKTVCGSFTRILKLHSDTNKDDCCDSSNTSSSEKVTDNISPQDDVLIQEGDGEKETETPIRKAAGSDIQSAVGSQLTKLDSLISKAERADTNIPISLVKSLFKTLRVRGWHCSIRQLRSVSYLVIFLILLVWIFAVAQCVMRRCSENEFRNFSVKV